MGVLGLILDPGSLKQPQHVKKVDKAYACLITPAYCTATDAFLVSNTS